MGCDAAVRNWFETSWVAARYARSRPPVHARIAKGIREHAAGRLERALDLGCGTGLSTAPLAELARWVLGADLSAPMLAEAARLPDLHWTRALAEALPFRDAAFDLVTLGCVWHWCEPRPLLAGLRRVLRPGGWLVVYDNRFRGRRTESSELSDWLDAHYYAGLPRTPRHPMLDPRHGAPRGFVHVETRDVGEWIPLTLDQLVVFLTTQSSTIAAVEAGTLDLGDAEHRLRSGLERFFPSGPETALPLHFGGPVVFLRRQSA